MQANASKNKNVRWQSNRERLSKILRIERNIAFLVPLLCHMTTFWPTASGFDHLDFLASRFQKHENAKNVQLTEKTVTKTSEH